MSGKINTLTAEYLSKHAPKSIIENIMSSCLYENEINSHNDEMISLKEIILFINALGVDNGLDNKNPILIKYRDKIRERIKELGEDEFEEKEEIESLFVDDAVSLDIPLSENSARLFFTHLYALSVEGYEDDYVIPKFLIEFHIAVLWDEGNMDNCVPQSVMDMYMYYY